MTEIIKYENGLLPQTFNEDDLIEQFLFETQEVKESTKSRYRKSLKKYFNWLSNNGLSVRGVTLPDLLNYKQYLKDVILPDSTHLSDITIGSYLVVVRCFYKWANARGFPYNPAATLKSPKQNDKYEKEPISPSDMGRLFDYFKEKSNRDYAIAKTLYYCGLRCMELCRSNYSDIKIIDSIRVLWVQGKGKDKKDNWSPMTDEVYRLIVNLAKERNIMPEGDVPIFVSFDPINPSSRLTPESVSRIIKTGLRAIGLGSRNFSAHSLRHSAGTNLTDNGASIERVRQFLRHANDQTSRKYAKKALERQRMKDDITKLL